MSRLPGDEKVQIVSAAAHVREDLDAGRGDALAVGADGALGLAMFVEDPLEDGGVTLRDFPVATHFAEGVDEEMDVGADVVFDCGTVDEEEAGGDPEGEGEGGPELVEHTVVNDVLAEGGDIFDCCLAALAGTVGGGENG